MAIFKGSMILSLLFLIVGAFAQPKVGSADRLSQLQKIQGAWRGQCEAFASSGASRQINITVSFTHFDFEVIEFSGLDCVQARVRFSQSFLYGLGPALVTKSGKTAYAIDFKKADTKPLLYQPHLKNLIYYKNGLLYLGRSYALEEGQRPESIDFQTYFAR